MRKKGSWILYIYRWKSEEKEMSLLDIKELSLSFGDKLLYRNAEVSLFKGEHMGIVGANGVGKSTLIHLCAGILVPDEGFLVWQPGIHIGYLDQQAKTEGEQTILDYLHSPFANLYELEKKMLEAYEGCAVSGYSGISGSSAEEVWKMAERYQRMLEAADFYSIDYRIQRICEGLGLMAIGIEKELGKLSGGQRAKVILAKLLLEEPDVLLLDEPTNFLDKEHIQWLSDYLSAFPKAFMVVSHDYNFLEKVCTCICDIEERTIHKYTGKYSDFLKQKKHLREEYIRRYAAQQREIKKTEEYIRKNIAGVNSKMAKGRRKQLERLERLEPPAKTLIKPFFTFPLAGEPHGETALRVSRLSAGYYYPVISDISFEVRRGQKIAITGFNGIGKSTLLKTLVGELPPLKGGFTLADTACIGYYEQESEWDGKNMTPLSALLDWFPHLTQKEARQHLAGCGIDREKAERQLSTLSGGEQAKVKLCRLTLMPSNVLILDEPTNHLDELAKEALKEALVKYEGTVILVSHEERFYRDWTDKVISMEK